uniref:Uncharacterized protein n=1 Tax=Ornithorhynchus anatinus TaxID=9258 RepID=A0A6I8PGD1_ORNAN
MDRKLCERPEPRGGAVCGLRPPPQGPPPPAARAAHEELDEELDHILSPPPRPVRKYSSPDVYYGLGGAKTLKVKQQLGEDGRQLRRGSLGGALTGRYLLPSGTAERPWLTAAGPSNLVRMRSQALGQSAPSLTAGALLLESTVKMWREPV